ncbi:sugar kinase [Thalassobaculum sp. OXR-137]|uniref:sugar kinase n=1 Tax=Thalassobaculum sp. OXR-137 TaxID=3100173 RepID=UPI002AC9614E|nr:sugar kinase [Thalassobaculum sp. OXR-137]WPZ33331.1 sugar kinase [Thalassobaculum sp. OXR-137]
MEFDLLCFGEAMVELTRMGSGDYKAGYGGDTSNCAIAAARQGARTGYITAVGDDAFGRELRELWQGEGVATDFVRVDSAAPTGLYIITPSPAGRDFAYYRAGSAASRYTASDLPREALRRTRIVQLSGISQAIGPGPCAAGMALIAAAREAGCEVAYDTNLRLKLWDLETARETMHAAMAGCTVALPSIDDSRVLTGLEDADSIVDAYLAMGPRIVALKMGEAGAMIATANERILVPPHPVVPVDATGAGDTFDGAFLAQLSVGADPVAAGRYAAVAAALTTTGYGAVAPIPTAEQVQGHLS